MGDAEITMRFLFTINSKFSAGCGRIHFKIIEKTNQNDHNNF